MRKLIVIAIILLTGMGVSFNNTKKVNEKGEIMVQQIELIQVCQKNQRKD